MVLFIARQDLLTTSVLFSPDDVYFSQYITVIQFLTKCCCLVLYIVCSRCSLGHKIQILVPTLFPYKYVCCKWLKCSCI